MQKLLKPSIYRHEQLLPTPKAVVFIKKHLWTTPKHMFVVVNTPHFHICQTRHRYEITALLIFHHHTTNLACNEMWTHIISEIPEPGNVMKSQFLMSWKCIKITPILVSFLTHFGSKMKPKMVATSAEITFLAQFWSQKMILFRAPKWNIFELENTSFSKIPMPASAWNHKFRCRK